MSIEEKLNKNTVKKEEDESMGIMDGEIDKIDDDDEFRMRDDLEVTATEIDDFEVRGTDF